MSRRAFLVTLCLVAFGVRAAVGTTLLNQGEAAFVLASDDGDAYDAAARWQAFGTPILNTERLAGKWDITSSSAVQRWPRGYWLFLAAQYRLFGSAYVSAVLAQALIGAVGVAAGYALAGRVLRSETAARCASIGMAISATNVYLSAAVYAEALYIPLLVVGLALLASPVGALAMLAAGLVFGLAELTRPLALGVFAVALAWVGLTRGWRATLCLALGFALALAPVLSPSVFTAGAREAVAGHNSLSANLVERAATLFLLGGWAPLGAPPVIDNLLLRAGEFLLAFAGMACLSLCRRTPAAMLVVASMAAIVIPPLLLGLPLVRYRAPADPLFIIAMLAAAEAMWATVRWRLRSTRPRLAPAASR